MKNKFFGVLLLLVTLCEFAFCSGKVTICSHVLHVERIECWSPQYLTVTRNYDNKFFLSAPSTLRVLSVITEINGYNTEYMNEEEFYQILDSNTEIRLSYMTKINGENKMFSEIIKKYNGYPVVWISGFDAYNTETKNDNDGLEYKAILSKAQSKNDAFNIEYYKSYHHNSNEYVYQIDHSTVWYQHDYSYHKTDLAESNRTDKNVILNDMDIDFFKFNTFDYAFNDGIEELEQKQLLREFATILESRGMKKVDKNPDVYLYVTLQSDMSIETVYMPKQVTNYHANTQGRITYGCYSTYGSGSTYSHTVTEEHGTMESFTSNDAYLQITMLDAKRMNSAQPPKVWQYTYMDRMNKNLTSEVFREKIRDYTAIYPFSPGYKEWRIGRSWNSNSNCFLGFYIDDIDGGSVTGCTPNSFAEKYKIQVGDKIKFKSNNRNHESYMLAILKSYMSERYRCIQKIGKKSMKDANTTGVLILINDLYIN